MKRAFFFGAILLVLVFYAGQASAQDLFAPRTIGVDKLLGVVSIILPDYEGSNNYIYAVAPLLQYKFGETSRYFQLIGNKVYLNILNHQNWEFGPKAVYRFGRDGSKDVVVKKMDEVDDSIEVGAFLGFAKKFDNNIRHRMNIHIDVTQDVVDGHEGLVAQLSGIYWRPIARAFDIGFRGNVTYANKEYMSSFFDVSANDSALSGLPQFDADAEFKDASASLMGLLHLNKAWHLGGGIQYQRLFGDAADSPVVDQRGDENQYFAGVSLLYSW